MANFFKANEKRQVKNKSTASISLNIIKLDINGCGVGRYNNKPIFIEGCLPKENVDIRLIEQKNKYSRGKLLKVNRPSSDRVAIACQHFSTCGGCDLQHLEHQKQLAFKEHKVSELLSRSGIDSDNLPWQAPIVSKPWHYRRKARIGVQFDKNAQAIVGFRQKATNQLVAIKSCPTLVTACSDIFPLLQQIINQLSVKKSIGHIEVIYTQSEKDQDILTLVIRQIKPLSEDDRSLWKTYSQKYQWQVVFDFGQEPIEPLMAQPLLQYKIADEIVINFNPDDFIQVNQTVNHHMVEQALDWLELQPNDQVLDLFCGLGNFSLPIGQKIAQVVGVEGMQSMVDKAQENAKNNHLNNCQFYQADLNSAWSHEEWAKQGYSKVVLDPARAGAEQAVLQLVKLAVNTILYISCEPATLARDSQILLAHGYKIIKIGLIDMFSQTKHVETMVLFRQ